MRLSCFPLLCCFALLLGACASSKPSTQYGRRGFWRPNHFDGHGRETGRWRTYYDDAKKQPFTTGRYRHGRPIRTFNYYSPTGQLDRSETYTKDGHCTVSYWHPDGRLARQGAAQWVTGKGRAPRFYWYGIWTSYAADGLVTNIQTYVDGVQTRGETYENGQLTRIDSYEGVKLVRSESYKDGQLLKVETFEKGLRTGTTHTL